jgi:hypothetical protein
MKAVLIGKGFSTLELLIAFFIISSALVGAYSISMNTQSVLLSSHFYIGAISRIEDVFLLKNIYYSTSTIDSFYNENIKILDITQCINKITVEERWQQESFEKSLYFNQVFSYPDYILKISESCVGEELVAKEWENYIKNDFNIDIPNITDIDVVDNLVYVSLNSDELSDPDIFIFDSKKSYKKIAEIDIGPGVFALDATRENIYVVTNSKLDQFVVLDAKNFSSPDLIVRRSLSGVDPLGSYPEGRSIKYFDKKIYIGTKETAGPELHIFNVLNPLNPYQIGFKEINHNVNDIEIKDGFAFLATSADKKELIVIDVNNTYSIFEVGFFNAGTSMVNDRDATTLYLIGEKIYIGRKRGAVLNPEFYVVDISIPSVPKKIGEFNLALSGNASYVSDITVSSDLVFISTTDASNGFFILDVSDPLNIKKNSIINFTDPLSALDMHGEIVYVVSMFGEKIYEIQKN